MGAEGSWAQKGQAPIKHDLSGRQLSGKPTKKGVYIHRGKKQVVK